MHAARSSVNGDNPYVGCQRGLHPAPRVEWRAFGCRRDGTATVVHANSRRGVIDRAKAQGATIGAPFWVSL